MTETIDRSSSNGTVDEPEESSENSGGSLADVLPTDRLMEAVKTLVGTVADRALDVALERVDGLTGRLNEVTANGGSGLASALTGGGSGDDEDGGGGSGGIGGALKNGVSAIKDKVGGALGFGGDDEGEGDSEGGGGGGGADGARGKFKFMNIFEVQDVGVPLRVAYDQWTQFADFPSFMKKIETVDQESDEKITWKAQVFWSHRTWETTIVEQIPDTHIIWTSSGAKGHADGAVTFHELSPNLTRIILFLEYYPQGFFEKTGNLWRAVGRRARLEFKHFCRHVTLDTLINRDELEGWRGTIRDSEVVKTHEEALQEEQEAAEEDETAPEDAADADEYDEDLAEDELADDELADEDLAEEDLAEDEFEDEDELPEDAEDLPEDADEPVDADEPADADDSDDSADDADEPADADDSDEDPPPRPRRRRRQSASA